MWSDERVQMMTSAATVDIAFYKHNLGLSSFPVPAIAVWTSKVGSYANKLSAAQTVNGTLTSVKRLIFMEAA
jgi:hypothetical protein